MRKAIYASIIVALIAVMTSCEKEEPKVVPTPEPMENGVTKISASFEGAPQTKSVVDVDNPETDETNRAYFYWMEGDVIGVNTTTGLADFTLATESGKQDGQFTHEGQVTFMGDAVYPFNASHTFNAETGVIETINMPASYTFSSYNPKQGNTNMPMVAPASGQVNFQHAGAAFLFRIKVASTEAGATQFVFTAKKNHITGDFNVVTENAKRVIKMNALSASGGANPNVTERNVVTLNFPALEAGKEYDFYIPVPIGLFEGFTVTLRGGTNEWIREGNERYNMTRGKIVWFGDSTLDDANCIMTQPGVLYEVKTNRVNEFWGNPNYNNTNPENKILAGTEWKVEMIWNQDVLRNGNTPWTITFHNGEGGSVPTDGGAVPSGIYHGMVPFYYTVSGGDITQLGGNILVGIKRRDPANPTQWEDTYLWSWHIWITDYVAPSVKDLASGAVAENGAIYYYTNTTKADFLGSASASGSFYNGRRVHIGKAMMDRSIGAAIVGINSNIATEVVVTEYFNKKASFTEDVAKTLYGLHYQFGRKDPFYEGLKAQPIDSKQEISYGVAHPNIYIQFSGDWTSTTRIDGTKNDLWSEGTYTVSGTSYVPGVIANKSIFDPCPKGWRVPTTNPDLDPTASNNAGAFGMWSNFGNSMGVGTPFSALLGTGKASGRLLMFDASSVDSRKIRDWYQYQGWFDHKTIYTEQNGITINSGSSAGDYWTATKARDGSRGYILNLTSGVSVAGMWDFSSAFPIRCVQE